MGEKYAVYCKKCGSLLIGEDTSFCKNCGESTKSFSRWFIAS